MKRSVLVGPINFATAGILQNVKGRKKRNALLGGDVKALEIGGGKGIGPRLYRKEHLPAARESLSELMA